MKQPFQFQRWFLLFAFYNFIFFLLQISFVVSKGTSFVNTIPLPLAVVIELLTTLLIHVGLYLLISLIQTVLLLSLCDYHLLHNSIKRLQAGISFITFLAILSANGYFFPLSRISQFIFPAIPHEMLFAILLGSCSLLGLLLLNTFFWAVLNRPFLTAGCGYMILCAFVYNKFYPVANHSLPEHSNLPANIILIGIDSLNPNVINKHNTPTLTTFIKDAVFFKETITPLGHTYPSWSTILTGLYPLHHNARFNLMPKDMVKSSLSIAWTLQKMGYQTLFATDDRRFNNIGYDFGFQHIVGPRLGVSDVLLGSFNDFPLSNLLVNLPIGRLLFPYNHMSRSSHFSYYPRTFDDALARKLQSIKNQGPFFIAIHYTLPHWPYAYGTSKPAEVNHEFSLKERGKLYLKAVSRADLQVDSLLKLLTINGYLENSLVILLSDHGEALYVKGSRQTSMANYQGHDHSQFEEYLLNNTPMTLEKSVGHGSDLLSPNQYHCLLAIKLYKHHLVISEPNKIQTRVSLLDITPTITQFLGLKHQKFDGISLLSTIQNPKHSPLPERFFIMESGMLPNQSFSEEKVRRLGEQYFTIDHRNNELQLKAGELPSLLEKKLYAAIEGQWILALYPEKKHYLPIILNLANGQWSDSLTSDFAKQTPAKRMLKQLVDFYQKRWVDQKHTSLNQAKHHHHKQDHPVFSLISADIIR